MVRKPMIAGAWYPADPVRLRSDIEGYLAGARVDALDGTVIGVISPHAGYVYSGQVAAHAYKAAQGKDFDAVILIGPSHRASFRGASLYDGKGYETPLGISPVDRDLAEKIAAYSGGMVSLTSDHILRRILSRFRCPFSRWFSIALPLFPS